MELGNYEGNEVGKGGVVKIEEGKVDVRLNHGCKEVSEEGRPCQFSSSYIIFIGLSVDAGWKSCDAVG